MGVVNVILRVKNEKLEFGRIQNLKATKEDIYLSIMNLEKLIDSQKEFYKTI